MFSATARAATTGSQPPPPGMDIASAYSLTTHTGFAIIAKSGHAFSAAVAVASMLLIVEPISSGVGSGIFSVL